MMWWVYEFVFWIALLLASPYYLLRMRRRGGYAKGFMERFGVFNRLQRERLYGIRPIWIHAVSVGEVDLALQLIHKLQGTTDGLPIVLSTTTSTGHAIAARKLPSNVPLFYHPLDSRFCFGKTHRLLAPKALILIEAELWPHHLHFCGKQNIPVILINARLSKRSYPRYHRFRWLFAYAFRAIRPVTLQSSDDIEPLVRLGFSRDAMIVTGSLKYDTARGTDPDRRARLLSDLAIFGQRPMWVAGSTHPEEEKVILDIHARLRVKHPDLLLAIAPRHAERASKISGLMRQRGVAHVLRTDLNSDHAHSRLRPNSSSIRESDALLLDTTGELKYLYERASLIFIGKSLIGHGGQNIIEPAALGKPVIFGPHMENFSTIVSDFLRAAAAIQVKDADELESEITRLLGDPASRKLLGDKAAELVQSKQGAIDRTLTAVRQALSPA